MSIPIYTSRGRRCFFYGFSGLFLTGIFILLFTLNMHRRLNHDEHQFIASAVLIVREHLAPYRDFAYFHLPNLSYVYALLYRFTDYYLLMARGFNVVCSWLLFVVIFGVAIQLGRGYPNRVRLALATGSVLLLAAAPIFSYTSGRAWNHDLPVLLIVLAFLMYAHGLRRPTGALWLWMSGLLVGFASTTRLSFAPAALAFLLLIWLMPTLNQDRRQGRHWTLWFVLGLLLSSLPALYAFWQAPRAFVFGNLEYARLNTLYREVSDYEKGMTANSKFQFVVFNLLLTKPANLAIFVAYLVLGLPRVNRWTVGKSLATGDIELPLIALLFLSFIPGAIAPTPPWPQYFYLFFPFFLLAALYGLCRYRGHWLTQWWFWAIGTLTVVMVIWLGADEYKYVYKLIEPQEWYPIEFHQTGEQIAELLNVTQDAQVLTVSPALPLEGGLPIYPEFATGPFALRAGTFLSAQQQAAYKLVAPDRLDAWLAGRRPQAVLVGYNERDAFDEQPLVNFAQRQGYTPLPLGKGTFLWVDPLVEWGGVLRLGTYTWPAQPMMPSESLSIVLYLESVAPIKHNLNIIVRIIDAAGREWVHDERWPWGRPTSTWKLHDVWFDGHALTMPANMPPGIYRAEVSFYDPATGQLLSAIDLRQAKPINDTFVLGYLTVGHAPTPRQSLLPAADLGKEARLLGTDLDAGLSIQRGATLNVRLYWQAQRAMRTDYTTFVHLVGPDGQLAAQQDKQPLDGFFPTSRWQPDQIVTDLHQLTLPADAPSGSYTLLVGLYDLANRQRLPVFRAGESMGDAVKVAIIQVK